MSRMRRTAYFISLVVVAFAVCGCADYEMDKHEVLSVIRFRDSSYVDRVLLPKGEDKIMIDRLCYTDATVYADDVLSVDDLRAEDMYVPLEKDYFLIYPYEVIDATDEISDYVLYDLKWSDLQSLEVDTDTLRILDEDPILFMEDVYPLKMHKTLDDFVSYLNGLIDNEEM